MRLVDSLLVLPYPSRNGYKKLEKYNDFNDLKKRDPVQLAQFRSLFRGGFVGFPGGTLEGIPSLADPSRLDRVDSRSVTPSVYDTEIPW